MFEIFLIFLTFKKNKIFHKKLKIFPKITIKCIFTINLKIILRNTFNIFNI